LLGLFLFPERNSGQHDVILGSLREAVRGRAVCSLLQ
jgi:hypothetical protein